MALIPDRAVVLTAASTSVTDVMEKYYADLGSSAWTATKQTPTDVGGSGSFSMTLRNAGNSIELNILNNGTPASPSADTVRLGINPDGTSDPIISSLHPHESLVGPIVSPNGFDFVDGIAGNDQIKRNDGGDFTADGFDIGEVVSVANARVGGNDGSRVILAATATALDVATGSLTDDTDDDTATITIHGAANFSGADGGSTGNGASIIGSAEFIVLEWPDALMFIFKDAGKLGAPWIWYWGKIWTPLLSTLASMGSVRLDGHAIMQGAPDNDAGDLWGEQQQSSSPQLRFRSGIGVAVDGVPPFLGSWIQRAVAATGPIMQRLVSRGVSVFQVGPENEVVLIPCRWGANTLNGTNAYPFYFIDHHLRNVPTGNSCFDMWTIGGANRYMVLWYTYTTAACVAVPVPADFNPRP